MLTSWPTEVVLTHWWLSLYRNFLCRITAAGKWNRNHLYNRKGLKHFQTTDLTGVNIWATFINNLKWSSVVFISLNLDPKAFSCMQHKWLLIYVMVNKGLTTAWTSWTPFQPKTSKKINFRFHLQTDFACLVCWQQVFVNDEALYCMYIVLYIYGSRRMIVSLSPGMHLCIFSLLEWKCGRCRWDVWKDSIFCTLLIEK